MPLEHERAFSANSPVGRYWLRNCVGFHVEGFGGGSGTVGEIGLGPAGGAGGARRPRRGGRATRRCAETNRPRSGAARRVGGSVGRDDRPRVPAAATTGS